MSQTKVYCDHGNLLVTQKMIARECGNHGNTGNSVTWSTLYKADHLLCFSQMYGV